jgi:hypothetical protein
MRLCSIFQLEENWLIEKVQQDIISKRFYNLINKLCVKLAGNFSLSERVFCNSTCHPIETLHAV